MSALYMFTLSYVPLFPTYTTYTTTTITKTACSIFFSHSYSQFCSQQRSSNHDYTHATLHIRLTEFLPLTVACFVLPFYSSRSRLHENSIVILCIRILVFPSRLLLLVYLERVRCICVVCIVYTLSIDTFTFITFL